MPDIMQDFAQLNDLTQEQLFLRRQQIVGNYPDGNYAKMTDENLQELLAIARVLRKRTSAPTRGSSGRAKVTPSLDAL